MIDDAAATALDFDAIVARHLPEMRKKAARLTRGRGDADDLVQDALLSAFRWRAGLRSPELARYWLLRILTNTFIDRLRRRRVRPQEVAFSVEPPAPAHDDVDRWAAISVDDVRAAVDDLPDDVRDAFRMYTFEGRAYAAIARAQGVATGTVGTRIMRARARLRARFALIDAIA